MRGDTEITGRQPGRRRSTWIDVVGVDLMGMEATRWRTKVLKEQNGHLSRGTLF